MTDIKINLYSRINIINFILIISNILSIAAMFLLCRMQNPGGYNLSIYYAIPMLLFILLYFSIFINIIIAIYFSFIKQALERRYWVSILNILIDNCMFVYSINRNSMSRGDSLVHLQESLYIINNFFFSDKNFYPISHILITIVNQLTKIQITNIGISLYIPFCIIYVLLMYSLAKRLSNSEKYGRLVGTLSAILVSGSYSAGIYPAFISLLFLVAIFYLIYFKQFSKNIINGSSTCLVILISILPFSHPLTTLLAIVFFAAIYIIELSNVDHKIISYKIILLSITIFISWFSSFSIWKSQILDISNIFWGDLASPISQTMSLAQKAHLDILDLVILAMKTMGGVLVYLMLAILITFVYFKKIYDNKNNIVTHVNLLKIILLLSILLILNIIILNFKTSLDIFRPLRYTFIFSSILIGQLVLIDTISDNKKVIIMCVILGFVAGLSMSSYPSSFTFTPNPHVTDQDLTGAEWLIKYYNLNYSIYGIWPFGIYVKALNIVRGHNKYILEFPKDRLLAPNHFGYDLANSIDKIIKNPSYIPIFEYDKATRLDLWKNAAQYFCGDFIRLNNDDTVRLLYKNGQSEIFMLI